MNISENGIKLIKSFEGCRLTAYKCLSSEKYYTIGYGHYGSDVTKGMTITQAKADSLLKSDLEKFVKHVNTYNAKYNFNQNQFDALVSFAFNIGSIKQLTKNGTRTLSEISNIMLAYNKSGGKVIAGLTERRKKEQELFNTKVTETTTTTKTNEEIAKEVIAGKWGNGSARKKALTEAGYDYKVIQILVNKLLKK